jgi:hypothetical protein
MAVTRTLVEDATMTGQLRADSNRAAAAGDANPEAGWGDGRLLPECGDGTSLERLAAQQPNRRISAFCCSFTSVEAPGNS